MERDDILPSIDRIMAFAKEYDGPFSGAMQAIIDRGNELKVDADLIQRPSEEDVLSDIISILLPIAFEPTQKTKSLILRGLSETFDENSAPINELEILLPGGTILAGSDLPEDRPAEERELLSYFQRFVNENVNQGSEGNAS